MSGYNVGPSKTNPTRDIVVQSRKRIAGKPTPWMVYETVGSFVLDQTITEYPNKAMAVKMAESMVDRPELGPRWERD